jgi:starvation-inducible DNA-binding protein
VTVTPFSSTISWLTAYPSDISSGASHVDALSGALAAYGRNIRGSVGTTDELGDTVTADVLTEVGRGIDKWLWIVEAHPQSASKQRCARAGSTRRPDRPASAG